MRVRACLAVVLLAYVLASTDAATDAKGPTQSRLNEVLAFTDNGVLDCTNDTMVDKFKKAVLPSFYSKDLMNDTAWVRLACNLMTGLTFDLDFKKDITEDGVNKTIIVPPTVLLSSTAQFVAPPHVCGRVARLWTRMLFHDCGTYDRASNSYGCDGSLRFEIPNNLLLTFKDVIPFVIGPSDNGFTFDNADHPENAGMAASTEFFANSRYDLMPPPPPAPSADVLAKRKLLITKSGKPISYADTLILGGFFGTWVCGGVGIPFVPGRVDATQPNPSGLLPNADDSNQLLVRTFNRMGVHKMDMVTLGAGSHSTQAFMAGAGDKTPALMDNEWAKEAKDLAQEFGKDLAYKIQTDRRVCDAKNTATIDPTIQAARAVDKCALPFIVNFAADKSLGKHVNDFALKDSAYFTAEFSAALGRMSMLSPVFRNKDDKLYDDVKYEPETKAEREERKKKWAKYVQRKFDRKMV